jgi:lysosomal alpha-mannosidase
MHDEACPTYEDMIDNMQIGHDFILNTFGVKPKIGWQIDPFGHSNTNARIFAEMGFDAWFFARLDYYDKNKRMNDLELEFVWRPSAAMGNQTQIFTHVLYNMYSSPQGFDFDIITDYPFCDWINDESTRDYNAPNEAENLIPLLEERISHYATDEILLLFGGDFEFYNA